ncbi:hypothetical protein Ae201684P_003112 [Aphanomyces euteiches]|uniref:3'-5' exonuclease domain-containing protein n=1 Tax=Aphanomyces euteiches TaxID=100861 RepID=A0A6G0WE17_9STRA|nr:hypothetical protein Ae201684_015937 [Aphanomyces euteiches]KAH9088419.1 hypothetical protein Ae201684P_003112 [Aphanomyces euteiches]KAH9156494.1 hypothetical protein AeRB84_001615 [Aphanomyces euteiches]
MRIKAVADLEWVLASPQLISTQLDVLPASISEPILEDRKTQAWLDELNADPTPLHAFIAERTEDNKPIALGVYFASLVEFWLRHCPAWHVERFSSSDLQASQLKYLFRTTIPNTLTPMNMHWEATVKFFLFCGSQDEAKLDDFVHLGVTATGDSLTKRIRKSQRKLELSRQGRSWLASHFEWAEDATEIASHMLLCGYLLYPLADNRTTQAKYSFYVPEINPNHLQGWWTLDFETDISRASSPNSYFAILPKQFWLTKVTGIITSHGNIVIPGDAGLNLPPIQVTDRDTMFAACRDHFASYEMAKPLMVAELQQAGDGKFIEVSRGAIVNPTLWQPTQRFSNLLNKSSRKSQKESKNGMQSLGAPQSPGRSTFVDFEVALSPCELVEKLREILKKKQLGYTALKKSLEGFLEKRDSTVYVVQVLLALLDFASTDMKDTFRLGQLVLDSYSPKSEESSVIMDEHTIARMEAGPDNWWALRFQIKALSKLFPKRIAPSWAQEKAEVALWHMLSFNKRWNATAVDVCENYSVPRSEVDAHRVLQILASNRDYDNAEIFVVAQMSAYGNERSSLAHTFIHNPSTPARASRRVANLVVPLSSNILFNLEGQPKSKTKLKSFTDIEDQRRRLHNIKCVEVTSVHVVDTKEGVEKMLSFAQSLSQGGRHVVGMDCEWRPTSFSQQDGRQVDVLQLAFAGGVIFVLDCAALADEHMEQVVALVLNAKNIILSGFSVAGDVQRLRAAYPSLGCLTNCVEVRRAAVARVGSVVQTWGLAALASTYLGIEIAKDQQVSDWAHRPLSSEQVAYAALDAHCARLLFLFFVLDLVESVEPLSDEAQHVWTPWLMRERNCKCRRIFDFSHSSQVSS